VRAEFADALPNSDPDRTAFRIAPSTGLCTTTWRVGGDIAETGFDELRNLCESVGDNLSLAIAMYGQMVGLTFSNIGTAKRRCWQPSRLPCSKKARTRRWPLASFMGL